MFRPARGNRVDGHHRWSLGRAISTSPELSVRILAANVLREALLAQLDLHLFWSPETINNKDPRLPFSFIADAKWLHSAVQYLRNHDGLRADLGGRYFLSVQERIADPDLVSRAKTHELLSMRAGPFAFSDVASTIPVTASDRLRFIIPAHQKRPLQILEVALVTNVEYHRVNGADEGDNDRGKNVQLQIQLRNSGITS